MNSQPYAEEIMGLPVDPLEEKRGNLNPRLQPLKHLYIQPLNFDNSTITSPKKYKGHIAKQNNRRRDSQPSAEVLMTLPPDPLDQRGLQHPLYATAIFLIHSIPRNILKLAAL